MDYESLMNRAKHSINKIPINTDFTVKELFLGAEWTSIPSGDRKSFGRYFSNQVKEHKLDNVCYVGKQKNNSALYKKISEGELL